MATIKNTHGIPICQVCGGYPCVCEMNARRNAICKKPPEPSPLDTLLAMLKPLEWESVDNGRWFRCVTPLGRFEVSKSLYPGSASEEWTLFAPSRQKQRCDSVQQGQELGWKVYCESVAKLFRERGE